MGDDDGGVRRTGGTQILEEEGDGDDVDLARPVHSRQAGYDLGQDCSFLKCGIVSRSKKPKIF